MAGGQGHALGTERSDYGRHNLEATQLALDGKNCVDVCLSVLAAVASTSHELNHDRLIPAHIAAIDAALGTSAVRAVLD